MTTTAAIEMTVQRIVKIIKFIFVLTFQTVGVGLMDFW